MVIPSKSKATWVAPMTAIVNAKWSAKCSENLRILSWSCEADFRFAWGLDGAAPEMSNERVLVVWDGDLRPRPATLDHVLTQTYVTPLDWAFWLMLRNSSSLPKRMAVMRADARTGESAASLALWEGLKKAMPSVWLFGSGDLKQVEQWFMAAKAPTAAPSLLRERLIELWKGNFTAPGNHHALGNLIGAWVLEEGFREIGHPSFSQTQSPNADPLREAVFKLVKDCGLFLADGDNSTWTKGTAVVGYANSTLKKWELIDPRKLAFVKANTFGRFDLVRFLLVDDQFDNGYAALLKPILKTNDKDRVWNVSATASPASLLALLECQEKLDCLSWDKRRHEQPKHEGELQDIVLLDLRLFSGSATRRDDASGERVFFCELLKFCDSAGCDGGKYRGATAKFGRVPLPCWEDMQSAIHAAKTFVTDTRLTSPPPAALALLPLLLAWLDPSLPIILFTSSQRRDIMEMFAPFPNIITCFSKPAPVGGSEQLRPAEYAIDLCRAIGRALELHEVRPVWEALAKTNAASNLFWGKGEKWRVEITPELVHAFALDYMVTLQHGRFADGLLVQATFAEMLTNNFDDVRRAARRTPPNNTDAGEFPNGDVAWLMSRVAQRARHFRAHRFLGPRDDDIAREVCIVLFLIWADFLNSRKLSWLTNPNGAKSTTCSTAIGIERGAWAKDVARWRGSGNVAEEFAKLIVGDKTVNNTTAANDHANLNAVLASGAFQVDNSTCTLPALRVWLEKRIKISKSTKKP